MFTMDRATGVDASRANWITRLLFRALRKRMGLVPKSKLLAAWHTPTLLASTWVDLAVAPARTVPASLKELAQLKVAALVGCVF
jgi:hypothetical protein